MAARAAVGGRPGERVILRTILPLLLFGAISGPGASRADSGEAVVHIVGPGSVSRTPVTSDKMWKRVRAMASKYRKYAPVPRVGFYDITYPASADEYRAVDGYGILMVTIITQDPAEVPLARVYLTGGQPVHTFQLASSVRSPVENPEVSSVLGATRFDALYLFPMASTGAFVICKNDCRPSMSSVNTRTVAPSILGRSSKSATIRVTPSLTGLSVRMRQMRKHPR